MAGDRDAGVAGSRPRGAQWLDAATAGAVADASRYEARNAVSAASSSSGGLLGEEVAGAGDDHALHVIRDDLHVVELTVERIDDGEVSPYLVDELRPGDIFEVRGPIGGHFTWSAEEGGPLLLIAGGSGLVPLMSSCGIAVHAARPFRCTCSCQPAPPPICSTRTNWRRSNRAKVCASPTGDGARGTRTPDLLGAIQRCVREILGQNWRISRNFVSRWICPPRRVSRGISADSRAIQTLLATSA